MYCLTSSVVNRVHNTQSPNTPEIHSILLLLLFALMILPDQAMRKTIIIYLICNRNMQLRNSFEILYIEGKE